MPRLGSWEGVPFSERPIRICFMFMMFEMIHYSSLIALTYLQTILRPEVCEWKALTTEFHGAAEIQY